MIRFDAGNIHTTHTICKNGLKPAGTVKQRPKQKEIVLLYQNTQSLYE
ncbi:hypothetical protein [Dyadobacter sp. 3J3]|nr:hypothetical protein [Dyadobacter sp. 3J3]